MIHIASIEDNPAEEDAIRAHLNRYAKEKNVQLDITWFSSSMEFISQKRTFDIILMDIDMPGINGMEAATLLRTYDEETPLIFITNLAQYAVKGYEVDALDFIVKPIGYSSFAVRLDKAMRVLQRKTGNVIAIYTRDNLRVLSTASIAYIEVSNHELIYHVFETDNEERIEVRGSLKSAESELGDGSFTRISNSCIINMGYVRRVQGDTLYMKNGDVLYFSRSRKKPAMEAIASFLGGSA